MTTILSTSTNDDNVMPAIELAAKFCREHPSANLRSTWGDAKCKANGTVP